MTELALYRWGVIGVFVAAAVVFVVLSFISAPYGRHGRAGWGPTISGKLGWVLMESPAVILFTAVFLLGQHRTSTVPVLLLIMWLSHYIRRTYIFPFRLRSTRPMPVLVMALAFIFQCVNAGLNARWISDLGHYPFGWLDDPRLIIGVLIFFFGMAINMHADNVLLSLRRPGQTRYRVPRGGLFHWVSSANYLGELIMWCGWAVATWSLAGLAFAVFTAANLVPRAAANHRWYVEKFGDKYPPGRKRLIPLLW